MKARRNGPETSLWPISSLEISEKGKTVGVKYIREPFECVDCGKTMQITGRGCCRRCWDRRNVAGTLDELPVRPAVIERYEEYLFMLANYPDITNKELAMRMGLSAKTIDRYSSHRSGLNIIKCLKDAGVK